MWLSASAFFHQYFRVYSPVAFGKKKDKGGLYIKYVRFFKIKLQTTCKMLHDFYLLVSIMYQVTKQMHLNGLGTCWSNNKMFVVEVLTWQLSLLRTDSTTNPTTVNSINLHSSTVSPGHTPLAYDVKTKICAYFWSN